jgi:murein L,D-transpeptidase YcbB/YkuD
MEYGLFPEDYHHNLLKKLRLQLTNGSNGNRSNILSQADVLYSDAFIRIAEHLKKGRLEKDSLTLTADTALKENYFLTILNDALGKRSVTNQFTSLEPKNKDYQALKKAIPSFLEKMDKQRYSYVVYPGKDSMQLIRAVAKRLKESGLWNDNINNPDSNVLAKAIIRFQQQKGIKQTGKINGELIKKLNTNDWYLFKRIALTLDRYKTLQANLPETYVWVNLPSCKLKIMDKDSVIMTSKVIIGKTSNRTPELNSQIFNIVLYPTWSVPYSIAVKEMLPIAKRNPGYFAKKGFKIFDSKGKQVDPFSINWNKYGHNVPFNFKQNEGDGNALGVIKFNFENPYAVYLHDTNQRSLFDREYRALSHGCVRVHLWDSMAKYLIRKTKPYYPNYQIISRDSITPELDTITLTRTILKDSTYMIADSLKSFMAKKRHTVLNMPKRIPIFIRYFSCEGQEGKMVFFEDIYAEDKRFIDKYFAKK